MENRESLRELLRDILREDRSLLARRDELIARLESSANMRMIKELSSLKSALRKNIGEYFLAVGENASDQERASVIEKAELLLTKSGMQERPAKNAIETLRYALRWDERNNLVELQEFKNFSDEGKKEEGGAEIGPTLLNADVAAEWCCRCGNLNHGQFCTACGCPKESKTEWKCAECGQNNSGAFCTGCGASRGKSPGIVVREGVQETESVAKTVAETSCKAKHFPQVSASTSISVPGTDGKYRKLMFGGIVVVLLIVFSFVLSGKKDTHSTAPEPRVIQRTSAGSEESSHAESNTSSAQQPKLKMERKTPEMPSDLGLGGICVGYRTNKVYEILGKESKITDPNNSGHKRYQYNDMEVVITNGVVTGFVSKNEAVATKRGIRQGSSLQEVLSAYGSDYSSFSYDGMMLYEYALTSMNNKPCLLRFAIKNGYVDYISARTL